MIYLAVGSNLGNRKKNIEKAKYRMIQNEINIVQSSNYYESLSWPELKIQSFKYSLKNKTHLTPLNLIRKCKEIEKSLEEKRQFKKLSRV